MGSSTSEVWVLAFDASCCRCHHIARQVGESGGDKLDIKPLTDPQVQLWRNQALGDQAAPAPTLIRMRGDEIAAWTGMLMAVRLTARLGPRRTVRLLGALGQLDRAAATDAAEARPGTGRRMFLRLAGVGVAAAVLTGRASAASAGGKPDPAREWARANRANLPQRYADFSGYDLSHRRAIFDELTPRTRSRLWTEHLQNYRATHPTMTDDQRQVFERALKMAGQETTFAGESHEGARPQRKDLREAAVEAFGIDQARALLAALGPAEDGSIAAAPKCGCNFPDDYCGSGTHCVGTCDPLAENPCTDCYCTGCSSRGCGTFWVEPCNGYCTNS